MTSTDRLIGITIIVASTCSEAVGQLAFKRAANRQPANSAPLGPFAAAWANLPWVMFGLSSFVIDGLLWSAALYYLDITVAHPIGSIVFVVVAIFSKLFLREKISPRRWAGICFILIGGAIVAMN
jgi:drug/metabolite transporter (DMT)-like permease